MSKTELAALEYQTLVGAARQAVAATAAGAGAQQYGLAAARPDPRSLR